MKCNTYHGCFYALFAASWREDLCRIGASFQSQQLQLPVNIDQTANFVAFLVCYISRWLQYGDLTVNLCHIARTPQGIWAHS